jgi:two-component system, chemotaxis family, sensor histidine kinase and response regulator WspE
MTDDGSRDLSSFSMMDLFRTEAEAQTAILNEGLLEIEKDPTSRQWLERLMRAAHSVKGAARIVGLTQVVTVAHALEDCFVAAQKGLIVIGPDLADILLKGADALTQMSKLSEEHFGKWIADHQAEIDCLLGSLEIAKTGGPVAAKKEALPIPPFPKIELTPAESRVALPSPTVTVPSEPEAPGASGANAARSPAAPGMVEGAQDRGIRVSTENLSRMMGLAGESAVQVHRLEAFTAALVDLKSRHAELLRLMRDADRPQENLSSNGRSSQARRDILQKAETFQQLTMRRVEEFDLIARQLTDVADRLYREAIASRMRPFADGVTGFPRLVRDLSKQLGKKVKFEVLGKGTQVDRDILDKLEAPLTHFLQNSMDHGIEPQAERLAAGKTVEASLKLEARHRAGRLTITVSDDGRGIDVERLRKKIVEKGLVAEDTARRLSETEILDFLFLPGFSTADNVTEVSGRGVGLDVVRTFLHEVGGSVRVENDPGRGVRFHLEMPVTRSVMRALVVEISGDPYAFPLGRIERLADVAASDVRTVEGRQYLRLDEKNIGLIDARQVLELAGQAAQGEKWPVVVIADEQACYGIKVDRFLGERELVVRTLDRRLGKVQDLSAVSLMEDGWPVFILDVEDLQRSIQNLLSGRRPDKIRSGRPGQKRQKRILVVDDSITVREMQRRILQNRGYEVDVAVDGMDGWNCLYSGQYSLVISDVDMPRMNGFDLVRRIRQDSRLSALPVMMVSYKERKEDRMRGLEAGANYYFTKGGFHDEAFMRAVVDLIGEAQE